MMTNPEQFSNATKNLFTTQLDAMSSMTNKAVEGVEQVISLNISTAKASAEETLQTARKMTEVKDAQELFVLSADQIKTATDHMQAYGRAMTKIATDMQAQFSKAAEAQLAEVKSKVSELVNDVSKNAPAGSEQMVAIMKQSFENANAGFEQINKVAKSAVETMESQVSKVGEQFTQAIEKTISSTTKH